MPPDTTRLLSSERCAEVVAAIRNLPDYDLVLFDTPPAFLLSDPVLLAEHLDGLLFVVGIERVNRDLPAQALERMQGTGVDVLGVLANLPNRRRRRQQSAYGYGYAETRYGGYQELASRYEPGDHGGAPESTPPSTETLRTPSRMFRGARRMTRWLDRRD
jgi:Mrp family chromosome partitioning ATPase